MRVLATGGAGYVGSAAVRYLLRQGHEVRVYDNLSTGHGASVPAERLIEADLADAERLRAVLSEHKIEAVMHFAGSIAVGESVVKPDLYYRNNVVHSLTLLEAMVATGVGRILFSSTAAVYAPSDELLSEQSPLAPVSPYAFSKYAVERFIADFSRAYGLGYAILRYFNASGASEDGQYGEDHSPETHLIPLVLAAGLGRRGQIGVFGRDYRTPDGTCIRDYVHVDDLADAHLRALRAIEAGRGEVYNIGTGTGHSVLEVIEAAEGVLEGSVPKEFMTRRAGDVARLVAGGAKLRERLGWRPQYDDLTDIIGTAALWHRRYPEGYRAKAQSPG